MIVWLDYEDGDSYVKEAAVAQAGGEAKYISAAQVKSAISGDCVISGGFTESEARELAELINSGSLPVKMQQKFTPTSSVPTMASARLTRLRRRASSAWR